MFKLGDYSEVEAADIADYLKETGVRVELKPSISASMKTAVFLEGRLSQLKERIEDFEVYDRYIEALKAVLSEDAKSEDLAERYISKLNPSWNENKDDMIGLLGEVSTSSDEGFDTPDAMIDAATDLLEMLNSIQFMNDALQLNEIDVDADPKGELGDDPLLKIMIDPEECDPEDELTKPYLMVHIEKRVEVRLDEMTTPLAIDLDEDFVEEYPEEYYKISSIAMAMERVLGPPGDSKKIDLDEFRETLVFEEDMESFIMTIDGSEVAEDIARILKKEGVIKIKNDKITWKK